MFRLTWSDLQNSSDAPASSDPTVSPDSLDSPDSPDSKLVQMSNKARNIWIEASFFLCPCSILFFQVGRRRSESRHRALYYQCKVVTEATNINNMIKDKYRRRIIFEDLPYRLNSLRRASDISIRWAPLQQERTETWDPIYNGKAESKLVENSWLLCSGSRQWPIDTDPETKSLNRILPSHMVATNITIMGCDILNWKTGCEIINFTFFRGWWCSAPSLPAPEWRSNLFGERIEGSRKTAKSPSTSIKKNHLRLFPNGCRHIRSDWTTLQYSSHWSSPAVTISSYSNNLI